MQNHAGGAIAALTIWSPLFGYRQGKKNRSSHNLISGSGPFAKDTIELGISSYFSSFKPNITGTFFLGCWSHLRCSGAWKSTLLLTELTGGGSLPINMPHPTLKRFSQGQFRPLRPACSQNRAETYNYAWSDFLHSVLFYFVVVVFCFLSKERPGEWGGGGGGQIIL